MSFQPLGLSEPLLRAVQAAGYETPSEIQVLAIPPVLSGSDVLGRAKTGSGKTAAFVLPILDRLSQSASLSRFQGRARRGKVRALVLAPTRELAQQINESTRKYGRFLQLRSDAHFGGVSIEPQIDRLRNGMDLLAATPGRLLDHLNRGSVDLSACEVLIVDEADRMFDMGFITDVKRIIAHIPKERQTLLFSATINDEVRKLAAVIMKDPVKIEVGIERSPVESVRQQFLAVEKDQKFGLLSDLLGQKEMESVLVFSRTKHGADKISKRLGNDGVGSAVLHANRSQSQRSKALDDFKRGRVRILIATDIAARGIDVQGISHVINFDTPTYAEDYIHRIGRTGRAEATGDAITFVSRDERIMLKRIESFTGLRFHLETADGQALPDRTYQARQAGGQSASRNGGHGRPDSRRSEQSRDNRGRNGDQRFSGPRSERSERDTYRGRGSSEHAAPAAQRANGGAPHHGQTNRPLESEGRPYRAHDERPGQSSRQQPRHERKDTRDKGAPRRLRDNGAAGLPANGEHREAAVARPIATRKRVASNIPEWALPVAKKPRNRNNTAPKPDGANNWSTEYSSSFRGGPARKNGFAPKHSSGQAGSKAPNGKRK
jgi:ATP-dependent RNA helicase RhlE